MGLDSLGGLGLELVAGVQSPGPVALAETLRAEGESGGSEEEECGNVHAMFVLAGGKGLERRPFNCLQQGQNGCCLVIPDLEG